MSRWLAAELGGAIRSTLNEVTYSWTVNAATGAFRSVLDGVTHKLRAIPDTELLVADPSALIAMDDFYVAVKAAVVDPGAKQSDPWVTASKICARKRPDLFPVRDKQVRDYLGLTRFGDYQFDWLVYRHLLGCKEVIDALDAAAAATRERGSDSELRVEKSTLCLLDAALWTYTDWYPEELKNITASQLQRPALKR